MATSKQITIEQLTQIAEESKIPLAHLRGVLHVEANGHGFSPITGKIIIQFEPLWMLRFLGISKGKAGKTWVNNGVGNQTTEWLAFNAAFVTNKAAAMKSTSWGMGQVMGFHYAELGFKTVDAFVDYCKESEANQVRAMVMFIKTNPKMYKALVNANADTFAYYYNGQDYLKYDYANRIENGIKLYSFSHVA